MTRSAPGVIAYLALAFGPAWAVWMIPLHLGLSPQSALFPIVILAGALAPAFACFAVRKWVMREGFADAGLGLNPDQWPYYLWALLIPLALAFAIAALAPQLGQPAPDFSLAHAPALLPGAPRSLPVVIALLTLYTIVTTPILWGEEFGWRSYLQIRLFASRPLFAAIATGIIWGVWHYPLLMLGTELPGHPQLVLAIFPVYTVLLSIVFGWLRLKSGSIWPSSLSHSAINHLRSPLIALLFPAVADRLGLTLIGLAVLGVVAVAIVAAGGLKPAATPA
jgi:membrane protease YdiL (CAAX protease family)